MATRLALTVDSLAYGGLEKYVVHLANHLPRDKFQPILVCLRQSGAAASGLRDDSLPIFELHRREGNDVTLPFKLARILSSESIDLVLSNNWSTLLETSLAKRIAGTRALIHAQHGMEYGDRPSSAWKRALKRVGLRYAIRASDRIVAVSAAGLEWCRTTWDVPDDKLTLIPNGVETSTSDQAARDRRHMRRELGLAESDFVIGSVASLRAVKNFPCLIESLASILDSLPSARLIIAGDGPERETLEELIVKLGLEDEARLLGERSDVPALLHAMDVFALASHSEGMSLAILEAMGAGLPVVATSVGGNPEIIADGSTGLLVPPDDSDSLANAVLELYRDPRRRERMSAKARTKVETSFSMSLMVQRYEELFTAMMR